MGTNVDAYIGIAAANDLGEAGTYLRKARANIDFVKTRIGR